MDVRTGRAPPHSRLAGPGVGRRTGPRLLPDRPAHPGRDRVATARPDPRAGPVEGPPDAGATRRRGRPVACTRTGRLPGAAARGAKAAERVGGAGRGPAALLLE